ncbi:MAG: class III signal peptide-containing protein [Methanobacteriaceae archaeon]|nr:class III signal peptide-containing protein [Methanobacteriaceae archaeon]MDP2835488.1 class III signal peptide-containing protein [Methanobacteriaceae archaeon]MDP3034370.1 class III signal peptide-containing protein [Methanobacteriaceae archaeon]MDP3485401.1 class III signal peptide-containing protein [Methanobacteriaceae archaeon]MDP3622999.1 class III signal peptide-containing protein [Methanobacteriaceae archaeon]
MSFLKDEAGQGAAEYILLFGGVIVIAIAALVLYKSYFAKTSPVNSTDDMLNARASANN